MNILALILIKAVGFTFMGTFVGLGFFISKQFTDRIKMYQILKNPDGVIQGVA